MRNDTARISNETDVAFGAFVTLNLSIHQNEWLWFVFVFPCGFYDTFDNKAIKLVSWDKYCKAFGGIACFVVIIMCAYVSRKQKNIKLKDFVFFFLYETVDTMKPKSDGWHPHEATSSGLNESNILSSHYKNLSIHYFSNFHSITCTN